MNPHRARRILCLWFPRWPIQRLTAARPELEHHVLLLVESTSRGDFVRDGNQLAHKRGIRAGMPLAEARACLRRRDAVMVNALQPAHDKQTLKELALRCETYSFCIGLEDLDQPECVLMDVTGMAHFFAGKLTRQDSGENALVKQLLAEFSKHHFAARIAIADTIGAAWAAAHFLADEQQPIVVPAGNLSMLDPLPVAGLRLAESLLKKLQRLGIRTIRQLLDLERAALISRLGAATLLRLDQLTGERTELITPCRPVPRYCVERLLEDGIIHTAAIKQLWSMLLRQLLELLPPRWGTRRLECAFLLENHPSQAITVRVCEATANRRHISDLLQFKLEQFRFPSPVIGLRLEALDMAPLDSTQQEFFAGNARNHPRQLSTLLNRLSNRLGEQAVVSCRLLSDPVPERAVRFVPVTEELKPTSTMFPGRLLPLDRPLELFPEPRRVEVIAAFPNGPPVVLFWNGLRFEMASVQGPERIESGWWQGAGVHRDYYRVETIEGRHLWLFRRLQDQEWFWHGEI